MTLLTFLYTGFALACFAFAATAIWLVYRDGRSIGAVQRALVGALAITALWSLTLSLVPLAKPLAQSAESLRNLAWLGFLYMMLSQSGRRKVPRASFGVIFVLALVSAIQIGFELAVPRMLDFGMKGTELAHISWMLRMLFAAGALVMVHNIYLLMARGSRRAVSLPLAALAAMWCYDLNLYTIGFLADRSSSELEAARGWVMMALLPLYALGAKRNSGWRVSVSRRAAFHSASIALIGAYLTSMVVLAALVRQWGGSYAGLAEITLVIGMSLAALFILPSGGFKAWLKVQLVKHFFEYRYDYREEWMRFTDTMGRPDTHGLSIEQRVIKALGDICESPGGLLLLPDDSGSFALTADWNWPGDLPQQLSIDSEAARWFAETRYIVDLDALEQGKDQVTPPNVLSNWALDNSRAWIVVPFVHFDHLVGIGILARPRVDRPLDWEDLDVLRVASAQVASYLSEMHWQRALDEAQRFEEFNRRFAFIMHDIKNLVSQLSLLARNAERHAENPEFRADMIETLQSSVSKMQHLLARISPRDELGPSQIGAVDLGELAARFSNSRVDAHQIDVVATDQPAALGDPLRVEQILTHLVQNAAEASEHDAPILIEFSHDANCCHIHVVDQGQGMEAAFIRDSLFKPFASTKDGGFGIGAYEARSLARSMKGDLLVSSTPGEGSRFTLVLPREQADRNHDHANPKEKTA